jgi:hypothetical protein
MVDRSHAIPNVGAHFQKSLGGMGTLCCVTLFGLTNFSLSPLSGKLFAAPLFFHFNDAENEFRFWWCNHRWQTPNDISYHRRLFEHWRFVIKKSHQAVIMSKNTHPQQQLCA